MGNFRDFLKELFAADAPTPDPLDSCGAPAPAADSLDWRAELSSAELEHFPTDAEPPAAFLAQMLAARLEFAGEIIEVRYPELGGFDTSSTGRLIPDALPAAWREFYEERAAIREYDGGQTREHAEAEALAETIRAMKGAGVWPIPKE